MESLSKNKLTDEHITALVSNAFPGRSVRSIAEMTAGMCNALYRLTLDDGTKTVLKVSSPGMEGKATNESWLMESEVGAMTLMAQKAPALKVPGILFYDDSMTLCSGKYFFMEYAEGELMRDVKDEERLKALRYRMGEAVRQIGEVKNSFFGILGSGITFDSLHGVVYQLISNVIGDITSAGGELGVDGDEILRKLKEDKPYFDEVKEPSLVHFDVWENNIIVKDDEITGILDWERALWGEPLMEDRFRSYGMNPDFLRGFGQTEFTLSERRRLIWYNIWINLAFMGERYTRGYMNEEQYNRVKTRMLSHWNQLD